MTARQAAVAFETGPFGLVMGQAMEWRFTRTRLREGYSIADVDAFLDHARESLAGACAAPLTPAQVREQRFRIVWLRPGYAEDEVDAALDEIEARLAGRPDTRAGSSAFDGEVAASVDRFAVARSQAEARAPGLRPEGERFEVVRRGYGRGKVDVVVDRVDQALQGREPFAAQDVSAARFDIARRGYDRDRVDAWRASAADALTRRGLDESAPG